MPVSRVSSGPAKSSAPLPTEFSHPALQQLLARGATRGSIAGADLRTALETAGVPARRLKTVVRAFEEQGITVDVDSGNQRAVAAAAPRKVASSDVTVTVSYTHLRAHETVLDLVCRLLLEKKKINKKKKTILQKKKHDNKIYNWTTE